MFTRRSTLLLGIVLLAAAPLWSVTFGRRWTDRIPPGWSWEARFSGTQTNADSITGKIPERDVLGGYFRRMRISDDRGRPDSIRVRNELTIIDPESGKTTWQYITSELVDPRTGARLEPRYRGDFTLFPRGVQQGTYRLRSNYLEGIPLTFQRTADVAGLATYAFSYRGRIEYAAAFVGTPEYPGVKVAAGQELRCADDKFYIRFWVEPHTGETVKLEEGCPSGDYVYDIRSGTVVSDVDRWGGSTAGTELLRRVADVSAMRDRYLYLGIYMPWVLAAAGAVLVAGSLVRRKDAA